MIAANLLDPLNSTRLISLDRFFNEMIELHNLKKFPKVLLLNGKKGIGKFTLVMHFLNYIFTKNEKVSLTFDESFNLQFEIHFNIWILSYTIHLVQSLNNNYIATII